MSNDTTGFIPDWEAHEAFDLRLIERVAEIKKGGAMTPERFDIIAKAFFVPVDCTVYWDAVYRNWGHRSSVRRESLLGANVATLALVVIVITLGSLLVYLVE